VLNTIGLIRLFSGLSDIIGSFSLNLWQLISYNSTTETSKVIAELKGMEHFPFGASNWTFSNSCIDGKPKQMPMKISKVKLK
jgi:hypothetical protein